MFPVQESVGSMIYGRRAVTPMLLMSISVVLHFFVQSTDGAAIVVFQYLGRSSSETAEHTPSEDDSRSIQNIRSNRDVAVDDVISGTNSEEPVPKSRSRRWTSTTISTLQSTTSNLQSRSVCPWTYSYNNDPTRQPPSLIQAQCNFTTVPGTTLQCEHVYSFIPVKVTDSTTDAVSDQWLKLKVGCTLATPPVVNTPPVTIN